MIEVFVFCLLAILLGVWNGLVIQWYITKEEKYSKAWHSIGFIIRALPILLIYDNLLTVLCYLNFAWTGYNMVINLLLYKNIFYIGKTSFVDKKLGRSIYYLQALLIVLTISYWILL